MKRRTMIALLLLISPLLAADELATTVQLKPVDSSRARPRLLFPRLPITLLREPVEGIPKLSDRGVYAAVRAGGKDLKFAFDAIEGSFALGKLIVRGGKSGLGKVENAGRGGFRVNFLGAKIDGVVLNLFLRYRGTQLIAAYAEPARHRRGRAILNNVVREVMLIDADGDGKFNGADDRWLALRQDKTRKIVSLQLPATCRRDEPQAPFAEDGRALMVRNIAADGSSLELVLGKSAATLDEILTRRYMEFRAEFFRGFALEGDAFAKRSGLDTKRATVKEQLPWVRESFEQAKARAKKEGKPLIVAHFTETNDWWWRYLYYTFRDREVDRLLRNFVLTAIDAEKDPGSAYQDSGARGLPAFEFLTPDGRGIKFELRARDEKGEARNLGVSRVITGWLRPVDFEVNLRRVLNQVKAR